jgi:hypothetical protein
LYTTLYHINWYVGKPTTEPLITVKNTSADSLHATYEPTVWGTAILALRQPILSQPWNSLPCKKPRVHHHVQKFPNLDRTPS